MTDRLEPDKDQPVRSRYLSRVIENVGGTVDWVVPAGEDPGNLATDQPNLDASQLNDFKHASSASSLDIDIAAGAAFIAGRWVARDTTTTVSLDANTTGQVVYAGWDADASQSVIIGKDSAFNADDPQHALWEFDTDSSGVTAAADKRRVGEPSAASLSSAHLDGRTEHTTSIDATSAPVTIFSASGGRNILFGLWFGVANAADLKITFDGAPNQTISPMATGAENLAVPIPRLQNVEKLEIVNYPNETDIRALVVEAG